MEVTDTVMSPEQYEGYRKEADKTARDYANNAEISFKAGRDAERDFILQNTDRDERARQEGRKEVVEWVNSHTHRMNTNMYGISLDGDEWRAQCKQWGG